MLSTCSIQNGIRRLQNGIEDQNQARLVKISSKCLHNLLLSEEMIHRNNESPLISTHLRSPNVREFLYSIIFLLLVAGYLVEFLYSIIFLLLVAGYLVRTHLIFVW
ncbi:hypothetical protein POM88_003103 [Heracleum sosnowskyi]|uniref:Ycf2 N-terminal domain-containing protein n=1 Tax=Heracleum sosnowskyi TaxID=360622 RepID=A0AAD8JHZ0_9APIA|nr:hypothetical protein POM88_003103 [Heracleum sosnowskyi]